jgi:hypothetical protein
MNIPQGTSNDRKRQDIIQEGVTKALLSRESILTMLGGDLNAVSPGGRFGYATGNAKHNSKVDEDVQNFVARQRRLLSFSGSGWGSILGHAVRKHQCICKVGRGSST